MKKNLSILAVVASLGLILTGCSSTESNDDASGKVTVVAALYPLEFVATAIGGDLVDVVNVTPPGVEPHDLELTPSQIITVDDADLLLYISGFQPALEEAAEQSPPTASLDILTVSGLNLLEATEDGHDHGHDHGTEEEHADEEKSAEGVNDPHVWLDPERLIVVANAVAAKLSEVDPDNAQTYANNAELFVEQLTELDGKFVSGLASCERDLIVTAHAAFGYLADAYGLNQEAIAGISPESEPTPKRLN
jgi:zinc transport system substrate-binding protein